MKQYFVIDGSMSTALKELGYHCLETQLWSAQVLIDAPALVRKVHRMYFEAGADCGITDSYQASIKGFMKAGFSEEEAERLIVSSVRLFKEARVEWWKNAPHDRTYPLCLGSVGPYGAYLADGSEYRGHYHISDQELRLFHQRRIELLNNAGVDCLLFETVPSLSEALIEADLAERLKADYWISFSCRDGHHTCAGETILQCIKALENHPHLKAIGVNCTHPIYIRSLIEDLKMAHLPIVVYPNSGEVYDVKSKRWTGAVDFHDFEDYAYRWYQAGANGVGGCCRCDERFIRAITKGKERFLKEKDCKRIIVK